MRDRPGVGGVSFAPATGLSRATLLPAQSIISFVATFALIQGCLTRNGASLYEPSADLTVSASTFFQLTPSSLCLQRVHKGVQLIQKNNSHL